MKIRVVCLFSCAIVLNFFTATGQDQLKIDSLSQQLANGASGKDKIDLLNVLANEYSGHDSAQAVYYAQEAIRLARSQRYMEGLTEGFYRIGANEILRGNYPKARRVFQQTHDTALWYNYTAGIAKSFNGFGIIEGDLGNYPQAISFYDSAIALFFKAGNEKGASNSINNKANINIKQGNFSAGINLLNESLEIDLRNKAYQDAAICYSNIAVIHYYTGKFAAALENYHLSISLNAEHGNSTRLQAANYLNLGSIYGEIEEFEKSIAYLKKALTLTRELKDRNSEALAMNNLGKSFLKLGEEDTAQILIEQALIINQELGLRPAIANSLNELAGIMVNKKAYKAAKKNLNEVINIRTELGEQKELGESLVTMGVVEIGLSNPRKAEQHLTKALRFGQDLNSLPLIRSAAKHLSEIHRDRGNYKKAYTFYVLEKEMQDSLFMKEQFSKISRIMANLEFTKQKDSIQFARESERLGFIEEGVRQENKQRLTTLALGFSLLLISVLIIFFLYWSKNNLKLRQAYTELEQAYKDIHEVNEQISKLNENLESVVQKRTQTLERRNESLERYATYNSHVLRAPIARFLGLITILKMPGLTPDETQRMLDYLYESSEELDRITHEMQAILKKTDTSPPKDTT